MSEHEVTVKTDRAEEKPTTDLQLKIAARAYEIFQQRGCHHGLDVEDWLKAEREMSAESYSEY